MSEMAVAFLDLLGFREVCQQGLSKAAELLEDYQTILVHMILDEREPVHTLSD